MKKRIKKGFTLIELIVVMAIFSILMVAVMALTGPVQRMFKNTALSEKTYSYANNIQLFLQGKLEYAEDLYVCTSDKIDFDGVNGVDDGDLVKLAEEFRNKHFKNTVGTNDGTNTHYIKGNIHILRLCNNDVVGSDGKVKFKRGEITHRVYDFTSNNVIDPSKTYEEKSELNPAFFNAQDSAYNFNYALGSSNLKIAKMPDAGDLDEETKAKVKENVVYRALDRDMADKTTDISATNLSLSIVLDQKTGGSIDIPAVGTQKACRVFASPVAVQIANLPLTNIAIRCKHNPSPWGLKRPKLEDGAVTLQGDGDVGSAYSETYASADFSFTNDIYFVYAYTDELY
jgi:prepilin-type N-terminal cleavage/methylation domain-containing protein